MYVPAFHQETDLAKLQALIVQNPLGTWVSLGEGELVANHIPFLLDAAQGEYGTLCCHVARANPIWKTFSRDVASVVIFQGANSYITPSWYASKQQHGKAVPTWNYAVVHAHGIPRVRDEPEWLRTHLAQMTDTHEARQAHPWKLDDAPADFIDRLLDEIVGIEIPVTKITGKWKTSQNRPEADKAGVVAGLLERGDSVSRDMAALVRENVSEKAQR